MILALLMLLGMVKEPMPPTPLPIRTYDGDCEIIEHTTLEQRQELNRIDYLISDNEFRLYGWEKHAIRWNRLYPMEDGQ